MPDELVCVTGATGFIAAQIVRELLAQGYKVRGTVRDVAKAEAALADAKLPNRGFLTLVEADLLVPGSFDAAVAGASCVMHTASPYRIDVEDPQRDLVDPALLGTREVLGAAARAGVKRVVLTSSMAAVTDEPDGRKLTEKDWNTQSSLTRNPYYYSKVLAEKAAWEMVEKDKPPFSLTVINPFMVIGPSLTASLNQSNEVIRDVLVAKGYPGIVDLSWGFVDVRDVALAHVLAMMTPKARGRYICAAEVLHMRDVVKAFRKARLDERYPVPKRDLSGWFGSLLVKVGARFQPKGKASYLKTHLGRVPQFDNSRIKRHLGITFRKIERTLIDTVQDLDRWGHLAGFAKANAPELADLAAQVKESQDALRRSAVSKEAAALRKSAQNLVGNFGSARVSGIGKPPPIKVAEVEGDATKQSLEGAQQDSITRRDA